MDRAGAGRIVARLALVGAALVAPFALLSMYATPQTDDFACGEVAARDGVWAETRHLYLNWTGRYAANAVLAWCGLNLERAAVLVPLLLMAAWWLACWRFLYVVGGLILGPPTRRTAFLVQSGGVALLLLGFYLTRMPSPFQGFYWLSGSLTYMPAGILSWMLLAELTRLLDPQTQGRGRLAIHAIVGSVVVALLVGFNETTMFLWDLVLAAAVAVAAARRWRAGWLAVILASAVAASAAVVLAPGNTVRSQGQRASRHEIAGSVGRSTVYAAAKVGLWSLDPALWVATLLFVPALRRWRPPPGFAWMDRRWSPPGIAAVALSLMLLGAFPAYWAMGNGPPLRSANLLYVVFVAGWILTAYSSALAYQRWQAPPLLLGRAVWIVVALFAVGNWPRAAWDLCVVAPAFRREVANRDRAVQHAVARGERDVVLEPLHRRPKTLFDGEISEDPADWRNGLYARRLRLASVRLREGGIATGRLR